MRFWDASAIVPLLVSEPETERMRNALNGDEDVIVWWGTRIECLSALNRRGRDGTISPETVRNAKSLLTALASGWSEVLPTEPVRQRAERLLSVHPLKAADAFQLAAALVWAEESPQGLGVVCLDQVLREGAFREGFTVLP